ncbi:MAG: glycosyltransferase family 39 protein [Bacteroidales bacterium]|nr:glycosyltransferase family 39 protein [Bacteroidales bacterium]MDD3011188.1 glycosyltransferase family 39 protein [Bacteroidales bacterium]MDD3960738.1 glycosyltransferase family 39 protein [Bacteroidales bacterium]MDY0286415.1 glycosyltransferase family 39 protein [Bacteroidales bacterium]
MNRRASRSTRNIITLFLFLWGILSLLQAAGSGLIHDEAYYRMFALNPDTGYFDHPPMTAWLMIPGLKLFNGALGVRFTFVITGLLTLMGLFYLIKPSGKDQVKLLILLLITMPIIHVGSFLAVPDIPMVFFSVMFFIFLKQYIYCDNLENALLLTLPIAGMLYSKYHGILLIFFTIIAFPQFFKRKSFYVTTIISLLLFLPHILWQYQHNFITLGYHLSDRAKSWSPFFISDYIGGQLLLFGGLATIPILHAAMLPKKQDPFSKILKFNLIGILVFFFVASFRMHIEANWTVCLAAPLIFLSFRGFMQAEKLRRWLQILAIPTIFVIVVARVFIIYDFVPEEHRWKNEFHGWDEWAEQIKRLSGVRPVVFMNSYQKASKYAFYTHRFSHTFNSARYRKNQYDLWDNEERVQGKEVLFIPNKDVFTLPYIENAKIDSFKSNWGEYFYYAVVEEFKTLNKITIEILGISQCTNALPCIVSYTTSNANPPPEVVQDDARKKTAKEFRLRITNPYPYPIVITQKSDKPVWLVPTFLDEKMKNGYEEYIITEDIRLASGEAKDISIPIPMPNEPGTYYLSIGLAVDWLPPGYNSDFHKIIIK